MKSYSVGSLNAMCNACLFLAIIWALYDLLSLVITFTDIFFERTTFTDIYIHSFGFLCMVPINDIQIHANGLLFCS